MGNALKGKHSMKKLTILSLLALIIVALVITGCAKPTATPTVAPTAVVEATGDEEFTLEELAAYNGKDGAKAYIAVDGVVYDVTEVTEWADGMHNGYEAGKDLSAEIKDKSPHGVSKLDGVVVVGKLVE